MALSDAACRTAKGREGEYKLQTVAASIFS